MPCEKTQDIAMTQAYANGRQGNRGNRKTFGRYFAGAHKRSEIAAYKKRECAEKRYASSSGGGSGGRGTEPHSDVSATLISISASVNSQYSVHEKESAGKAGLS
jgi:hypothetical protein